MTTNAKPSPLDVECPRCGIEPGRMCSLGLYVYRPARWCHKERYAAAREERR